MKLFSKLNLLTLALGGVLILGVPAVKADSTNQQSTAKLSIFKMRVQIQQLNYL